MPTAAKPPVTKAPAAAKAKPKTAAIVKKAAPVRSAAQRTAKPVEKTAVVTARKTTSAAKKITPATPESKAPASAGRKRLSKAFARPLDKKLAKTKLVRDRFTIPETEYEQLVELKKRLSALGFSIKKSELVRAGLLLLGAMDDTKLKAATAKLSAARIDD
jgi:hypothetical protein